MSNHRGWLRKFGVWLPLAAILIALFPLAARAADSGNDGFNIQVSPSPLSVTLKPGQRHTAVLTVRNLSNHSETLTPRLNGFTIDDQSEKIELTDDVPLGLGQWISFKQARLDLAAGASKQLEIMYDTPSDVGFSYALAITLHPAERQPERQGTTYEAQVAVFNLINIDRPGAKRELSVQEFKSEKARYEFLPANFSLTLKNEGNVIDQPVGNLFIQREFNDSDPIATIPINQANSYILPDVSRTFTSSWKEGFPHYEPATDGSGKMRLSWNWRNMGNLRMGKYVAKVVLVYNDGQRDVPVIASTTFWVIPWKLILATLVIGGLVVTGLVAWIRLILKGTNKVRKYAHRHK
jgi:hypothetical protein